MTAALLSALALLAAPVAPPPKSPCTIICTPESAFADYGPNNAVYCMMANQTGAGGRLYTIQEVEAFYKEHCEGYTENPGVITIVE